MSKIATGNARHYVWGDACDGWHLLEDDDLSVIEERVPPGASEVRHLHHHARQFFYVLEGEATLEVSGTAHVLHRGEGLHVPPGAAHQLRNESAADIRFLVVSAPKSHGDRETVP
jgi:mannose-6-phosphate isomerase-like protein (cupin superfamily)